MIRLLFFFVRKGGKILQTHQVVLLLCAGIGMFAVIGGLSLTAHYYTLNGMMASTVRRGEAQMK